MLTLTDKHRVDRVDFVLSHFHRRGGSGVLVDDMFDKVLVDEKWFYLMKDGKNSLPATGRGGPQAPEGVEQAVHPQDGVPCCCWPS
ncbi:unnamed protein product [Discosporangium mesarthrocarpum]